MYVMMSIGQATDEGTFTSPHVGLLIFEVIEMIYKVVLDIATRPAPTWLHNKYPVITLADRNRNRLHAVHRYMEDVGHPVFQGYAYKFARWSRKLNSFEDVEFPVSGQLNGAPERMLDMWRFFSDEQISYLVGLSEIVRNYAPKARETTNHWGENPVLGFNYLTGYREIFDIPGIGFYPGVSGRPKRGPP